MMALNLVHRAQVPEHATRQGWPVAVLVHGWLGNENAMSIFDRTLPPGLVVVSPRAPLLMEADSYGWYSRDADPASFQAGLEALALFVRGLPTAYRVDATRVLLMGFSQGAAMSYALLLHEPALVAAVVGMAGFLPEPAQAWAAPGTLAGQPVFIAHGTADETVPAAQARAAAEALRAAGAAVDFREYAVGHKMNAEGMREMKDWVGQLVGDWQAGAG